MFNELQLQAMATQQHMSSELQTTLLSTLVTTDVLVRTDANIWELQASIKTLTEPNSKHSLMLENVDSNILHITKKVLPILSTNLAMLRADYYGRFPTSEPSSLSPSAMGNETPTGQLESRSIFTASLIPAFPPLPPCVRIPTPLLRLRSNP
jgi:hypothetical protein